MQENTLKLILKELEQFERFTVNKPTEQHAIHIKYVLKTTNPQSMIKSLELLRPSYEVVFWVLDDNTVLLGEIDS